MIVLRHPLSLERTVHLKVADLRWASAQSAADDLAPELEADIRRAVRRLVRYRRDRQRRREFVMAAAKGLAG